MAVPQGAGGRQAGAVAVKKAKSPMSWLVPVLIGLLLLIALAVGYYLLNQNDSGDDPGPDVKDDPAGQIAWDVDGSSTDGYQLVLN